MNTKSADNVEHSHIDSSDESEKPATKQAGYWQSKWSAFIRVVRYVMDGFDTSWMFKDVYRKRGRQ